MKRIAALFVLLTFSLGFAAAADARPASSGPNGIPAAQQKPGTLLSYEQIGLARNYRATAWRIKYVTRDYKLRPILSTGIVVLPGNAPANPAARKFIAWAHPTTGVAWKCAPSLRATPTKAIGGLNDLVAHGLVVAATDYPGLGTPGPIGYLVGKGQAYAVIDSIRAAKQIPEVGGGNDFGLWGFSQGGHAVLFAAQLAAQYAPELNLKGVAAIAPPTDLATLLKANLNSIAGRILASFTLASWNAKYGAPLTGLLDGVSQQLIDEVSRNCVDDLGSQIDAAAAQKGLDKQFLKADPSRVQPWNGLMVQNSLYALNNRAPALIIQGGADDIVKPEVTTLFVRGACQAGANVQYVMLKGKGHSGAMEAGRVQAVSWLAQRLAGQPARGNCR
ncbi:MAG: alpha/beta fold hydrolase [Aestuariivirga sp.]|uniref:alpha/beta fold hydrolase n=1 Tax=Aestuariivirga sp. TaxID=2650926 RepID=UPI0025B9DBC8|nr:alpha/beta fold hydrolase [Aestuariivirga sp.]MCA3562714.1 alpha/beta fold hydrolase [Aestuariivirga sp.]